MLSFQSGRLIPNIFCAFEQFMRVALAEQDVASGRWGKLSDEQRAAHSKKVIRLNFGQLLDRVAGSFKLGADEKQVFEDAKGFRHHLAHDFWVSGFMGLHSNEGVALLVEECEALEVQFRVTTELLFSATGIDAAGYVEWTRSRSDDPEWHREKRRLLDDCWRAHREAGHI